MGADWGPWATPGVQGLEPAWSYCFRGGAVMPNADEGQERGGPGLCSPPPSALEGDGLSSSKSITRWETVTSTPSLPEIGLLPPTHPLSPLWLPQGPVHRWGTLWLARGGTAQSPGMCSQLLSSTPLGERRAEGPLPGADGACGTAPGGLSPCRAGPASTPTRAHPSPQSIMASSISKKSLCMGTLPSSFTP